MISIGSFITLVRDQREARRGWEDTRNKSFIVQAVRLGKDIDRIIGTQDIAEEGLFDVVEDLDGYRCAVIEERRADGSWRLVSVVSERDSAFAREQELRDRCRTLSERYLTEFRYWFAHIKADPKR